MRFAFSEFHKVGDDVLAAAFQAEGLSIGERLSELHQTSWKLGNLLMGSWESKASETAAAIHGATILSCLPSTEIVARGEQHNHKIAEEVLKNLRPLAKFAITANEKFQNEYLKGIVSELSVLSALWWGIAEGYAPSNSYASLSRIKQDTGTKVGRKNGIDIIYRENDGRPKKYGIQVKTGWHSTHNAYAPRIKVIATKKLVPPEYSSRASEAILRGTLGQRSNFMDIVWKNIRESLSSKRR